MLKVTQETFVPVLVSHADSQGQSPQKRPRLFESQSTAYRLPPTPLEELVGLGKRRRIEGKTPESECVQSSRQDLLKELVEKIKPLLPRVGKRSLEQPEILQAFQDLFPEKTIKRIQVCKGSDRTLPPPTDLMSQEAPYRKAIILSRQNDGVKVEKDWEMWKDLSQRQIIRPAHPARVNITMFAAEPSTERLFSPSTQPEDPNSESTLSPRTDARDPQDHLKSGMGLNGDLTCGLKPSAAIDAASKSHGSMFMSLSPEERKSFRN